MILTEEKREERKLTVQEFFGSLKILVELTDYERK